MHGMQYTLLHMVSQFYLKSVGFDSFYLCLEYGNSGLRLTNRAYYRLLSVFAQNLSHK